MFLNTEITSVGPIPVQPYESSYGPTWFIEGNFTDGSYFSRGAKSVDGAQKLRTQLLDLVGKSESFEVEDSNREYQGKKKWKLKAVPGQQAYQGNYGYKGGSGGSARPASAGGTGTSYRYSEQGAKEEQDSIHRSVALTQAVLFTNGLRGPQAVVGENEVLNAANAFYGWLTASSRTQPQTDPATLAFDRYISEIRRAVQAKEGPRLDRLMEMIKTSLSKGSLTIDQVAALDDELIDGKRALASAAAMGDWYKTKQDTARKTEPVHANPAMADTILQAQDAF